MYKLLPKSGFHSIKNEFIDLYERFSLHLRQLEEE